MKRDYKLFINDIKESIRDIDNYLKNLNEKDFLNNKNFAGLEVVNKIKLL